MGQILPALCAGVAEVRLSTELRREFGETVTRIHLDTIVGSTASVGRLESSVESGAMEGDKLVEAVSDALESTTSSINNTVRPARFSSLTVGFANDLLWDFDHSIKDVTDSTAKFTGRSILRSWRGLDVCLDRHCEAECEDDH